MLTEEKQALRPSTRLAIVPSRFFVNRSISGSPSLSAKSRTEPEIDALCSQIMDRAKSLVRHPSMRGLLDLCVATRIVVARLNEALLLGGRVHNYFEMLSQAISIAEEVELAFCSQNGQFTDHEAFLARKYYSSMKFRRELAELGSSKSSVELFKRCSKELGVQDLAPRNSTSDPGVITTRELLGAAGLMALTYWITTSRLMVLSLEIEHEAGPFREGLLTHCTLAEELERLVMECIALCREHISISTVGTGNERIWLQNKLQEVEGVRSQLSTEFIKPLREAWAQVASIPEQDRAETAAYKAVGVQTRAIKILANRATQGLNELRRHVSDHIWNDALNLETSDNALLQPTEEFKEDERPLWNEHLRELMVRIDEFSEPVVIENWLSITLKHRLVPEENIGAELPVLFLLENLLEIDLDCGLDNARVLLSSSPPHLDEDVVAHSIVGLLMRATIEQKGPVPVPVRKKILEMAGSVPTGSLRGDISREQFSRIDLHASLLALAFSTSGSTSEELTALGAAMAACRGWAGESKFHFYRRFLKDLESLVHAKSFDQHSTKLILVADQFVSDKFEANDCVFWKQLMELQHALRLPATALTH